MIREANINDIDKINELGLLVNKNFINVFNVNDFISQDYNKIYVYEIDKNIVGMLMITCLYETCEIINIVVDNNYRNKLIASKLLEYMINNLNNEVNNIILEVSVKNENAIKLYKKYNFEIINIRKNYYDGIDAYVMGVKL